MKIKWIENCSLEVVETYNEETEEVDSDNVDVKIGEIDEVDDVGQCDNDHTDLQFGNGSVSLGVPNKYFEVIEK